MRVGPISGHIYQFFPSVKLPQTKVQKRHILKKKKKKKIKNYIQRVNVQWFTRCQLHTPTHTGPCVESYIITPRHSGTETQKRCTDSSAFHLQVLLADKGTLEGKIHASSDFSWPNCCCLSQSRFLEGCHCCGVWQETKSPGTGGSAPQGPGGPECWLVFPIYFLL